MTLHNVLALGDLGNGGSMLLNLLLLVKVGSEDGLHKDVDLILRLEPRRHLLVDDLFGNGGGRSIGVVGEELLHGFNGEGHSVGIIHVLFSTTVVIIVIAVVVILLVIFILGLGFLILGLLLLLLVLGLLLLLFLLLFFIRVRATSILFGFLLLLLFVFILLATLLCVLLGFLILGQDVSAQLVSHIHRILIPTRRTLVVNHPTLDLILRLRQPTIRTKHKQLNVLMHHLLQHLIRVRSVHHRTIRLGIVRRLSAQFASEEFVHLSGITVEREAHVGDVGNDGFDAISLAFDFPVDGWHFVAIFGIIYGGGS
mmetsp:Transcript_4392/g.9835  ORF Transcript_4392/g.9835 Transcript_4392/m.9835 type:complete len:312 (+) Transcript_4392:412-1347(+)